MASGNLVRRPAVLLAFGLCAFGGVVTLLGRLASGPVVEQKRVPLTTEAGAQAYPAFSPDGRHAAYSAQSDDSYHVFVRPLPDGAPRQLTQGSDNDIAPVWSPDGSTLAFLRVEKEQEMVMLVPAAGGAERKIADFAVADESVPSPAIAWTQDGQSLLVSAGDEKQLPAITTVSLRTGEKRRLTNPPEGSQGDANPVVSPDGKTLAFVRRQDEDRGNIYICDMECRQPHAVTFEDHTIRGLTWSSGGQDLIYGSDRGMGWRLWRLPAYGGSPRDVIAAGSHASFPAVSRKGDLLAFTESPSNAAVWRAHLGTPDDPQERQVIRSAAGETGAAWSPDGKRIANVSEQSGMPEIWVGDANGQNRVQITHLDGPRIRNPRWSPDGGTILFETRGQNGVQLYKVPSGGGKLSHLVGDAGEASWSHDGKSILYSANAQIWRVDADGSNPRQLTHRFGSRGPEETSDGKWVYYESRRTIWRVPAEGGKEEEVVLPEHDLLWAPLQVTKSGVYYSEFDRSQRALLVTFYDFAEHKSRTALRIKDAGFNDSFSVSPDGQWILYPKTDRHQTSLALIENFR